MRHDHGWAHGSTPDGTFGGRGMLVAGGARMADGARSSVYLSSLPTSMAPHDVHVIVRAGGAAARTYGDHVAHFGSADVYTFVPEDLSVDDLAPADGGPRRTSLRGTLFRGHVERGGSPIARNAAFDIDQVVRFEQLVPAATAVAPGPLRYLCVGEPDAVVLAHLVTGAHDFDHLVDARVRSAEHLPAELLRAGVVLTFPDRPSEVAARLRADEAIVGQVEAGQIEAGQVEAGAVDSPGAIEITVTRDYYLETGDLSAAR
jgi:hypothetical protein